MEGVLLIALLVCPIAMGAMMFLMMRGMRRHAAAHERGEEGEPPVTKPETAGYGES